jgi:two-component system chemotaxis response regulator CheB
MVLGDGRLELTRGPRENWARPAIDPLFRSAALHYGPEAIGVVLSGRLNDGTAGLHEIKHQGGVAVVQTPAEAESPDMPQSALDNVAVDYCLPVAEMPRLLARLSQEPSSKRSWFPGVTAMPERIIEPSAQTCPECGGAMREEKVGTLTRFRCHIGHVMTAEVLASTQLEKLENEISSILRTLNERAALCREIAGKQAVAGNSRAAESWERAAEEAEEREKLARQFVDKKWTHPEVVEA